MVPFEALNSNNFQGIDFIGTALAKLFKSFYRPSSFFNLSNSSSTLISRNRR
jgi:hypothetical protein